MVEVHTRVTVIVDLVGSRRHGDRAWVHRVFTQALAAVNDALQELAKVQLAGIEVGAVLDAAVVLMAPPEGRDTRRQVAKRALTKLLKEDDWPYELEEDGTISVL